MRNAIINLIRNANIQQSGWVESILDQCQDKFAQGYLAAKIENLDDAYSRQEENYREDLLLICEYDIWGK